MLCDALPADPAGRELLPNLERLAEQTKDWRGLLDVYARVARARTEAGERVELLRLRAEVRERKMADPSGALDEMLRSFALAPENPATQEEILRLARVTGRWEEAIRVEGQLFALAETLPEKLEIARNAAYLVEHEVKDLVRAFRAYLNAFRLAPGRRRDRRPPVAAGRQHRQLRTRPRSRRPPRASPPPRRARPRRPPPRRAADRGDRGRGRRRRRGHRGRRRRHRDRYEADTSASNGQVPARRRGGRRPTTRPRRRRCSRTPSTPSTLAPTIPASSPAPTTPSSEEAEDADVIEELDAELLEDTRPPPPQPPRAPPAPPPTPSRVAHAEDEPFATPWEELADAYDGLPAEDVETRRVYLRKIVEVWERGQKDIDRALGALERAFRLDIKDPEVRAELERIGGQYDRWDRIVDDLPGRHRRVRADRHRGGAAPRRRAPARAPRADRQGRGAIRRDPAPQVRRRGRAGARRGDVAATSSAGRTWPTCSRSGPARRPRRCRSGPAGARGCASWRGCTRIAWSGPTRRSTRSSGCCSRWPRKSAATAKRRRPRRTSRCWARTRRWRGCIRASGCGARSSTA